MLDLNQMSVFVRVVQEGSFTGAAKALGMPKSRVSRMITDLEDKLKIRLLERTTREVRPTDVGLQYYEQYKPLFEEINDIHARISDDQDEPSGRLKITAPVGFALEIMGRWTTEFKNLYPKIDIEVNFNDGDVHLIRDGYDVGFAIGPLEDSSLIARKFDDTDPILCASKEFIERYGPFTHPDQLKSVPWVLLTETSERDSLTLNHTQSGESVEITTNPAVKANHTDVVTQHITAGHGIAVSSGFFIYEKLISGELELVLPEWEVAQEPLYLVFPSGRHQAKKVRAFIDYFINKSEQIHEVMEECAHLSQDEQVRFFKEFIDTDSGDYPKIKNTLIKKEA